MKQKKKTKTKYALELPRNVAFIEILNDDS